MKKSLKMKKEEDRKTAERIVVGISAFNGSGCSGGRDGKDLEGGRAVSLEGMLRKTLAAMMCAAVIFAGVMFVGCNDSAADPGTADGEQNYEVELYYVNMDYVNEGDESLGRFKPAMDATISATPGGVYMETLKDLSQVPDGEGYATMLKSIKVDSAVSEDDGKTVAVDFESQGLSGGSTEEGLLIEQIVRTLTESFDQVKRVKFTVDGAPAETLMGHMDTTVPYGVVEMDDGEGDDVEVVMPIYE